MFKTSFSFSIVVGILAIVFMLPTCGGTDCGSCGPSLASKVAAKIEAE